MEMALMLMPQPPVIEAAYHPFLFNRIYYPIGTPVWPVSIVSLPSFSHQKV